MTTADHLLETREALFHLEQLNGKRQGIKRKTKNLRTIFGVDALNSDISFQEFFQLLKDIIPNIMAQIHLVEDKLRSAIQNSMHGELVNVYQVWIVKEYSRKATADNRGTKVNYKALWEEAQVEILQYKAEIRFLSLRLNKSLFIHLGRLRSMCAMVLIDFHTGVSVSIIR